MSVGIGIIAVGILITLCVIIVSPAMDGLHLKPATCTVVRSEITGSQSCRCGKSCSSSFPCLRIYVNYFPKDNPSRNVSNMMFHATVYENNDMKQCSVAPCLKFVEMNEKDVMKFQSSKGVVGESYTCFYNYKKPEEVVAETGDFKLTIMHCILWPTVFVIICIGWTLLIYYRRHTCCSPKDGQNVTLVWN